MLVTNGLGFGGAERIVEALAHGLIAGGDAVHVVATTRGGPIRDALRAAHVPVSVLHIGSQLDFRVPLKLANVARNFRPDVLHSHLAVADIASALAQPLIRNVRLVTTVHNTGIELDRFKLGLWQLALRRFDKVLAVSEQVRRGIGVRREIGLARPSLVELEAPGLSRSAARQRIGIDDRVPLVMSVGRLTPIKGFDVLKAAATLVKAEGVRFVVIGEGEERRALEGGPLELIGARDDAAALLAAADVVVCPSRSEGFPQIPLEAMAAGRPVIATRVGGTPEAVIDGETGVLVEPESPRALAAAIDALLGDEARRESLGRGGRARLEAEGFSKRAMITRTRRAYDNRA